MGSIAALFWFSIRQTLWQRKIWSTILLLAAPLAVAVLVRSFDSEADDLARYHAPIQFVLLALVMPLVCLLHGTSLIGSEIEARTLVYLLTRRMRRATVFSSDLSQRALSSASCSSCRCWPFISAPFAGLDAAAFESSHSGGAGIWEPTRELFVYLRIIPVGVFVFLSIFTLVGLLASKPLAMSIGYFVLIELILSAIPIPAQKYTVAHQLRASMYDAIPRLKGLWDVPRELLDKLYPAGVTGTTSLVVVLLAALALACVLVTIRELTPSKVARE